MEVALDALRDNIPELETITSKHSKSIIGQTVSSLRQRWSRLCGVVRAQEKGLVDTVREWQNFTEKVRKQADLFVWY